MLKLVNRLTLKQSWIGKNVILVFPVYDSNRCRECGSKIKGQEVFTVKIPHDDLLELVRENANYLNTYSWQSIGTYSARRSNQTIRTLLRKWKVDDREAK